MFRERFRRKVEAPDFSRAVRHGNEDELLARVLIPAGAWHGRILRGVPPQSLTEDELISFWADDHIPAPRTGSG